MVKSTPDLPKCTSPPCAAITSSKVNESLSKTCSQVCVDELSSQPDHDFVVKVVQFQELLDVRHRYSLSTVPVPGLDVVTMHSSVTLALGIC